MSFTVFKCWIQHLKSIDLFFIIDYLENEICGKYPGITRVALLGHKITFQVKGLASITWLNREAVRCLIGGI